MSSTKDSDSPHDEASLLWKSITVANSDSNNNASSGSSGSGASGSNSGNIGQHLIATTSNNNNNNNSKRENKLVLLSNLNPRTLPQTLYDIFSRFGNLFHVDRNTDENGEYDDTATIQFHSAPREFNINETLKIDGFMVKMKYGATLSEEQRPTYCNAQRLSLGVMLTPTEFVEEWFTEMNVKLSVFYDNRQLKADFRHLNTDYVLEIKFKDLTNEVVVENIGNATYLTIPLKQPALFYYYNHKVNPVATNKSAKPQTSRANMIPLYPLPIDDVPSFATDPQSSSTGKTSPSPSGLIPKVPTLLNTDDDHLKLETWTVYRIKFDRSPSNKHHINKLLNAMADYNLVPRQHQKLHKQLTVTSASALEPPKNHDERTKLFGFDVLYMLECCITQRYLLERNLCEKFYGDLAKVDPSIACGILDVIAQDKKRIWNPQETLELIWNKHGIKLAIPRKFPNHCSMLRKLVVTPTAIYVQAPTLEPTNRVVRHFVDYADRFIRVQFTDEDNMKISPTYESRNKENLYDRVFKTLKNGIRIGGRQYDYLAFSSSQLREHGCWFFAPYDETNHEPGKPALSEMNSTMIRSWMGDFSDIKIVAKHAARIGQCFSSTTPIIQLDKEQVEHIPDIVHNGYTFSDGVGNISYELANQVAQRMSLRVVPTAFQFRLGGAKGVLMVSNKLTGAKVQLRPSQIKFTSDHYMLEIIQTSTHISAFLNRQAITLLSTLGVKDDVFMDKLQDILNDLNDILGHAENAVKLLQSNADNFGISQRMANIIGAGYLDRQDPFIKNLLNVFRVTMLKNLKEKAKIPVKKGAYLLGVVDDTGTLKDGEIFCQVASDSTQTLYNVVSGKCVVFRNPCFHPGDIRVVTAADYPNLHHLKDVIVFPAVGYRDIPSMCSGGDLDGDDYTIFWDDTLMPELINEPPMDYTPAKPHIKAHVKTRDIQKFFVKYMNNDNLGTIANAHLATADDSDKGAMDGRCKLLAQLHSNAVDFPKSGEAAHMEEDLKVTRFPDFMNKEDKPMYRSRKVLGKLYRKIDSADYDGYEAKLVDETVYDSRLQIPGMERYIGKARQDRQSYNQDVTSLMNQYGVKTEAEMISGFVVTWLKRGNKKSDFELQKQTAAAVNNMQKLWRENFLAEFNINNNNSNNNITVGDNDLINNETQQLIDAKAAAWYYVTYHPTERARDLSVEGSYFSFPWVMDDVLVKLGRRFIHRKQTDTIPTVDEAIIQKYFKSDADESFKVTVLDPDDDDDDDDDDDSDNDTDDDGDNDNNNDEKDDTLPIISKRTNENGDGNDSLFTGKHNDDDDNDDDNDDDDDDDDDDDATDDDDDDTKVISLDDLIKGYHATPESRANKGYAFKALTPTNRDHQSTINADATEEDLANALL